ncbi:MAG TPA: hypothetical protein VHW26_13815 [Solirubrobacteraceae bacterium]|jgi:hypothetical protein|nr:hypothetical protein [Solirubrobacteraceae bacterium]
MPADAPRYEVVRTLGGAGYTDVALVVTRSAAGHHRHLGRRHDPAGDDTIVLYHRAFRPLSELVELEAYAAQLESAAKHAARGHLWCFVTTAAHRDGTVEVSLFDRWFDGRQVRCEQRASREFDSTDEASAAAALDFTAGLQAWAEQHNDAREAGCRERGGDELLEAERSEQTAAGARDLAALLAGVNRRT